MLCFRDEELVVSHLPMQKREGPVHVTQRITKTFCGFRENFSTYSDHSLFIKAS